jgi:thiol-disulfide isomerase/thioredoxin
VGWASAPQPVPDIRFQDADGKPHTLSDFRGKIVLLNVWATWCAPCRKEMPALDRLQQMLGGPTFEVVALSINSGGAAVVRQFYDENGIHALGIYVDPTTEVTGKLRTLGIPTTLLIDREGRERWRKTGPAEWDSSEIVESLRAKLRGGAS